MENLSFLGVPVLKHIRVALSFLVQFADRVFSDELAHNELPHLVLHYWSSSL